jgi:hypothetical protein
MKTLAGMVSALALFGVTGAHAQIVYPDGPYYPVYPAPPEVVAPVPAPPIVVAPPPYGMPYLGAPYPYPAVVNPYTGRYCTVEPSGYRWCWTP